MKSVGIVAEYNPFHFGHQYQLEKAREQAEDNAAVVAVMSGDFVQRGEAALMNKYARAEAACACGADCVFELPLPWALATAERFAFGAVAMLDGLGVTDLCFGTEHDDLELLLRTADLLLTDRFQEQLRERLNRERSIPYAEMRERLLNEYTGADSRILSLPNSTLGVEYLKARSRLGSGITPHAVRRMGNGHDCSGSEGFLSASELRERYRRGESLEGQMPEASRERLCTEQRDGRLQKTDEDRYLSRLLQLSEEELTAAADGSGSLGSAIAKAVRVSCSMDEIVERVSCRIYTRARVRRTVLSAVLGNQAVQEGERPGYARLLACTERGRTWLKQRRGTTALPVLTKAADVRKLTEQDQKVFRLTASAHDFYVLGYEGGRTGRFGEDWTTGPAILP